MMEPIARHRQLVGAELRRLREAAGVSGSELSRRLGWTQSRVSRYELGKQAPTEDEAKDMADALDISTAERRNLLELVRSLASEWMSYRSMLAFGGSQRQIQIEEEDARAKEIREFQQTIVPGLLQSPSYVEALMNIWPFPNEEERQIAIQQRITYQRLLRDRKKKFFFLLTEAVLWNRLGSSSVMREQLNHLSELMKLDHVHISIVPRNAVLPVVCFSAFAVLDESVATVETSTGEIVLSFPADVDEHRDIFEKLSNCAVTGKSAQRLIDEAKEDFPEG